MKHLSGARCRHIENHCDLFNTDDMLCIVVTGRQKKGTVDGEETIGEKGHRLPHLYIKLSTPLSSVTKTAIQKSHILITADAVQNFCMNE